MTETKFTKGKWRYSEEHECITTSKVGIVEGSKTICYVKQLPSFDTTGEEAKANAMLIAAAPEMFELLNKFKIIANYDDAKKYFSHFPNHWTNQLDRIIEKVL